MNEIINSEKELIMNKKEKQQEWSKKIAEFKRSGKTKEEWCKKKNISIKQFNYWLKQECEAGGAVRNSQRETPPDKNTATQWLPLELKEKVFTSNPLNIKIGAASIEVYPDYDKEFLLEILATLKSL
jgi:hypothetical protein